ncbi:extracellular solute-binding protein [Vibrio ezurae]|uniref:Putative peptide ABC transporter substrate-binding protein n=1 Tax=Vibrio ezurae NBRC 102218 TaxID=1219080 RepID=U3AZ79_9VIBR|nr:extracellular solute-binding protein [Vibrio ezurae]GAD79050.1 putative peptide ABC transporter substrate-binding protein [Vibrio ezurae NBRC 102218]
MNLNTRKLSTLLVALLGTTLLAPVYADAATAAAQAPQHTSAQQAKQTPQLPKDLKWISNSDLPLFASPNAKRGGTLNLYVPSYPLTMRTIGPDANTAFRSYLLDGHPNLLGIHPNTLQPYPELAEQWAFGKDNKTMYFRLDPKAKWSDGVPITADDYAFLFEYVTNKNVHAPFYNNYYTKKVTGLTIYDKYTIALHSSDALPEAQLIDRINLQPKPRHFFKHGIGKNYIREYNWKAEPTTGAFYVSALKKGRTVELSHVKDWWGYHNRYLKNRFNVDKIRFSVIRDPDLAYRYFEKGELDVFNINSQKLWFDKTNSEPFRKGYIVKSMVNNEVSMGPAGLFLNMVDPVLKNAELREGVAYATNFDSVIKHVRHGEARRQNGFGTLVGAYSTPKNIGVKPFSPVEAKKHFAKAGYTKLGSDGLLYNAKGQPLQVTLTYLSPRSTADVIILKEQAKKAGLDIELKLVDSSTGFKSLLEKKFQMAYLSMSSSLYPAYRQYFHSSNVVPQTNNFFSFADPEMDKLIKKFDEASTVEEQVKQSNKIQRMVMASNCFIPGTVSQFARAAHWRYVRLPEKVGTAQSRYLFDESTLDLGLMWIDTDMKRDVLAAKSEGRTFPKITHLSTQVIGQ